MGKQSSIERSDYGQGSIYQRKGRDGWYAAVWVVDTSGTRRKVTRHAASYPAARKALKELRESADGGVAIAANPTVGDFLTRWLAATKPSVKVKTYEGYESVCRVRVIPRVGGKKLQKLSALDLQGLYATLQAAGLSNRSIHHTHRVLHRAFTQALRWG